MKVILLENVRKVGSIGDIIEVKRGYARNFLIAQRKALFASKENIKEVEKIKNDLSKKDLDKKNFGYKNSLKSQVMNAKNKISYSMIKKTYKENTFNSTCHAGKIFGVIAANGDVLPCEVLTEKMGNIRDSNYDFLSIWLSKNAKKLTKKIKDEKCFCTYECAWSFNILGNTTYHPLLIQKTFF